MAFEETLNPFPLNIVSKEDSWDKLQLMLNIDPKYKIPAAEFNKVIQALNYLYTSGNSENEVIGPYDTYADLVDAYPVGQSNQLAIVYQDEEETDGNFLYLWRDDSWTKQTSTDPSGAVQMFIQGEPFIGLASLFLRFSEEFVITQIQGGGIQIALRSVTPTMGTGTALNLSKTGGTLYNMSTPSSAVTYTFTAAVLNGYARVQINANSEPVVTGATKIKGSDFVADENMYLVVWYNGSGTEYWFEKISVE